ncbi:putative polyketide synthase [Poronia punctata]|nr:putative polyketide synthase [Poronia punctata]
MPSKTILVFGPKPSSLNWCYLSQTREKILQDPKCQWMLDVVENLSIYWDLLKDEVIPSDLPRGGEWLQSLNRWVRTGSIEDEDARELPNITLAPLVVLGHLVEYVQYATQHGAAELDTEDIKLDDTETAGFCIGMLSAVAIASSSTWAQFRRNGAVAIRLAMLIGAIVDLDEAVAGKSVSLSVRWKSEHDLLMLEEIIHNTRDAYIAVSYDKNQATVTIPLETVQSFEYQLNAGRITHSRTDMYGRYHTELLTPGLKSLLSVSRTCCGLDLPDASEVLVSTYLNNGHRLEQGSLQKVVLSAILVDHCDWFKTITLVNSSFTPAGDNRVVSFGPEQCIPPSVRRALNAELIESNNSSREACQTFTPRDSDIAVVGMACNVPGAEDLDQFWTILMEGKSQHREVPEDRFTFTTPFRSNQDPKKKWWGNFVDNHDAFDHRFFHKTPREAASMDPQQRMLYQAAYQAVAQSGYFQRSPRERASRVGCYVGVCYNDYENNVSHHAPNAFSATGNLRGFVAGKISHYFGWNGPALTIDTACSSSSVAVHQACQAILSGECQSALAAGTNLISSPMLYQNLAAASFLSPTGQCKPFDDAADGYCRGEGVAVVYLKKMTQAIEDGDQIWGTIASTAVSQNDNSTPIFVPNHTSLSGLFTTALTKAGMTADQISVVEAHGTGTPVGDPAEYEAIRRVFAEKATTRKNPLQLGSVKGLVGHTEASSGGISLVKVLLMMHESYIPPQPSFNTLNSSIKSLPSASIVISTKPTPWERTSKAALINNYGASGSNASIILKEAPRHTLSRSMGQRAITVQYPVYISGQDDVALKSYMIRLLQFIKSGKTSRQSMIMENFSFNICRQSNPSLDTAAVFSCQTIDECQEKLVTFLDTDDIPVVKPPAPRPVIFCFGGQASTFVGLDRQLYNEIAIIRFHLDKCDSICRELGSDSIYPRIFQHESMESPLLQPILFSMQYACAMSWMECGAEPVAVVGHSFGELTALCVSGVLSLEDALKMVVGRSKLIETTWGAERGAMLAVEGDLSFVQSLMTEWNDRKDSSDAIAIACFNGPTSFTLAGTIRDIEDFVRDIELRKLPIKHKKLDVSHAFHCALVDPLKSGLERVGRDMDFKKPKIHLEMGRELENTEPVTSKYIADHMREPFRFDAAVQRLSRKYPSAIWLEAGSNSRITTMASRALGKTERKNSLFQPVDISNEVPLQQLIDATMNLWKAGLRTAFWGHSRRDTCRYSPMILPPYQFQKHRHWLQYKTFVPDSALLDSHEGSKLEPTPTCLFTFLRYLDAGKKHGRKHARFSINTRIKRYKDLMSGHFISRTAPICPATLQLSIAVEAILSIQPESQGKGTSPNIYNVKNQSPLCDDSSKLVFLDTERLTGRESTWSFKIFSCGENKSGEAIHVTGEVQFIDSTHHPEFEHIARKISYQQCLEILNDTEADYIIQGRSVYKAFSSVVDYDEMYQGTRKIVGKDNKSAGLVVMKETSGETGIIPPFLGDNFCQVAGIWANCMANDSPDNIYIANGIGKWIRSSVANAGQQWHVLARHAPTPSTNGFMSDIFVFDPTSGRLVEAILDMNFTKISRASMVKLLKRLTPGLNNTKEVEVEESHILYPPVATQPVNIPGESDLLHQLKSVLAATTGLSPKEIDDNANLSNIGIDSLVGMEMANDIESTFNCTLDQDELLLATTVQDLLHNLQSALGVDEQSDMLSPQSTGNTPSSTAGTSESDTEDDVVPDDPMMDIPSGMILEVFSASKSQTDHFIMKHGFSDYVASVMPKHSELSIALIVEAFKELGCNMHSAEPGQVLDRIPFSGQHRRFQHHLYNILQDCGIVKIGHNDTIIRLDTPLPSKPSEEIFQDLLRNHPDHYYASHLTYYTGSKLASILSGEVDGIKLLFGNEQGRQLLAGFYGDYMINKLYIEQMVDFLRTLASRLSEEGHSGTLKILEMGAGTGGTTQPLVTMLSTLPIPIEYTFTDLSPSLVASARKRFSKQYPFMKFAVHDIEKRPEPALIKSQHVVIATNAVHATRSLAVSTGHMHDFLRQDGVLIMLEMTRTPNWVDIVFGPLEGWWVFDDGRRHATIDEREWEEVLRSTGYGPVNWTDGMSAEAGIQRLIVALASGRPATPESSHDTREQEVEAYIQRSIAGFTIPNPTENTTSHRHDAVLITGATGSVGGHLVAHLARQPRISTVYCLNRKTKKNPMERQMDAFKAMGIELDPAALKKLIVVESDTSQPFLGLSDEEYEEMLHSVGYIVHNAWPMGIKSPLPKFRPQLQIMRNLIDLASQSPSTKFQFISSIATTGLHPSQPILETHLPISSSLRTGYAEAKHICEAMLLRTLPSGRAMTIRLGQVAGSKGGYWNTMEHVPFIIKSSQTLGDFPDLKGTFSWMPVDDVAAVLSDLLFSSTQKAGVYHVENPVRQSWDEILTFLASVLGLKNVERRVSFKEWLEKVREFEGAERENPAGKIVDFLQNDFERMACGEVVLDTRNSVGDSLTMREMKGVDLEVVKGYVDGWRERGFLK